MAPTSPIKPAGETKPAVEEDDIIRVETDLVQVPFRVVDRIGNPVGGLKPEDFKLEYTGADGKPAEIEIESIKQGMTSFTGVVNLDVSPSVASHLNEVMKPAVDNFLAPGTTGDRLLAEDRIEVLSFTHTLQRLFGEFLPGVQAQARFRQEFSRIRPEGGTSLWESLRLTEGMLRKEASGKHRIVLLVTDAEDTSSGIDFNTVRELYYESGIAVYFIQVGNSIESGKCQKLAERTGGKFFAVDTAADLPKLSQAFAQIMSDIRAKYLLSFYPPDDAAKNMHHPFSLKLKTGPRRAIDKQPSFCVGNSCPPPVKIFLKPKSPTGSSL